MGGAGEREERREKREEREGEGCIVMKRTELSFEIGRNAHARGSASVGGNRIDINIYI